jgi:hypothetical protein
MKRVNRIWAQLYGRSSAAMRTSIARRMVDAIRFALRKI